MKKYKFVLMTLLFSVGLVSCSDDDSNGTTEETARLSVELTDAPGDYEEVWVEVEDVMIKREANENEEEDWESLDNVRTGTYDLLTLTGGKTQLLADTEIPAGYLSQMRLILGDNNTIVVNGVSQTLKTPSGQTSGLKLQVNKELEADIEYKFILDFDVDKSVVKAGESGNFNLHPVLRLSAVAETGSISGSVHPTDVQALVVAENANASVSAFTDEEGNFKLNGLPAGTYKLTVTPDAESTYLFKVVNNVKVEVGNVTELEDTIYLPEVE
jgi:hypothetical protein